MLFRKGSIVLILLVQLYKCSSHESFHLNFINNNQYIPLSVCLEYKTKNNIFIDDSQLNYIILSYSLYYELDSISDDFLIIISFLR